MADTAMRKPARGEEHKDKDEEDEEANGGRDVDKVVPVEAVEAFSLLVPMLE